MSTYERCAVLPRVTTGATLDWPSCVFL